MSSLRLVSLVTEVFNTIPTLEQVDELLTELANSKDEDTTGLMDDVLDYRVVLANYLKERNTNEGGTGRRTSKEHANSE